jgi:hypothetical protein
MPGLFTTSTAFNISSSVWPFSSNGYVPVFQLLFVMIGNGPKSDTKTSYPCCWARYAAPTPLSPAPSMASLLVELLFVLLFSFFLSVNL